MLFVQLVFCVSKSLVPAVHIIHQLLPLKTNHCTIKNYYFNIVTNYLENTSSYKQLISIKFSKNRKEYLAEQVFYYDDFHNCMYNILFILLKPFKTFFSSLHYQNKSIYTTFPVLYSERLLCLCILKALVV